MWLKLFAIKLLKETGYGLFQPTGWSAQPDKGSGEPSSNVETILILHQGGEFQGNLD
jgi:hypothetical protein